MHEIPFAIAKAKKALLLAVKHTKEISRQIFHLSMEEKGRSRRGFNLTVEKAPLHLTSPACALIERFPPSNDDTKTLNEMLLLTMKQEMDGKNLITFER